MGPDDKTRILPDVADTRVGTHLSGIYELDERIASGGMGEVYRGHNIETGDTVALKIVLPEFARDQTILSLFRKEALILNHLSHEAIVRYHVFTIDPGIRRPYLAMEFVDGKSLFDVMRHGAMPTADVRKLCHRIASGLSAAHEAGTVHRDLSPDNIILPEGKVECAKIIDFGIARSGKVGGETLIGGRFAGKYNYVSPEQLGLYGGEVSKQSDIYSLGLVLAAVLRGKPLDMGGSQFEVVEKRRSVPDLSGIDDDFRPMIEAMLQPDPRNRPASMADIARATRDDAGNGIEGAMRPGSPTARPQTEYPWLSHPQDDNSPTQDRPRVSAASPKADGEPRFIPHRPPARLSRTRPSPAPLLRTAAPKRSTTRNMTIAAVTAVAVISGAGAYLGGFLSPLAEPPAPEGKTTPLSPDLSRPPAPENAVPTRPTPEKVAQSPPRPDAPVAPPADEPDVSGQVDEPIQPADEIADSLAAAVEAARTSDATGQPPADAEEPAPPSPKPIGKIAVPPAPAEDTEANDVSKESARASGAIVEPSADVDEPAPPSLKPPIARSELNPEVRQPVGKAAVPLAPAEDTLAPSADGPNIGGNNNDTTSTEGKTVGPPPLADEVLSRSDTADQRSDEINQQASDAQDETAVAMNLPKPQLPAPDAIDEAADRISWLRDYNGGDCFYATATSVSERTVEIEGFGTTVDPFAQMLAAFQAKFQVEPDVSVRLIDPAQCEVTRLLRALGATAAEKPELVLDRTSVPNGFPVSGTLETLGGLRSSLLLIDHKGMTFNLDGRVAVRDGKGLFSFPIGLGPTDQAGGKPVPQIIIAITGATDIQAANFSTPTPAALALPRILDEIQEKRGEYAATAKYFQLGG